MIKSLIFFFGTLLFFITASSCKKTPGEGGNAQIKGTYWVRNYDVYFQFVTGRYPAVNTSVYLFFGDDKSPGTSVKTNDKGEFEFTYLRQGKYRVVAYSRQLQDSINKPREVAKTFDVEILKRKDIIDIGLDTINQ